MKDAARSLKASKLTVKNRKIVVIGIGNLMRRDDGVGIHAIRALAGAKIPKNIDLEIIDGGLEPDLAVLVDHGVDKLIIIDAVLSQRKPGDIQRLPIHAVEKSGYETRSAHYLNMRQSLKMLELLGNMPKEIAVFGVEPSDMSPGTELSPAIAAKLPEVVNLIVSEIAR